MALRGNLKSFPSHHLFDLIHTGRKTGTLKISSGKENARLVFRQGTLIYTVLNGQPMPLADILLSAGAITDEEKAMIDDRSRVHTDQETGVLLESVGLLSRDDILRSLYQHHKRQAEHVLAWGEGEFVFDATGQFPRDHMPTAVRMTHLLHTIHSTPGRPTKGACGVNRSTSPSNHTQEPTMGQS